MDNREKLILVDATAFCYRAFHAIKGLSTSFGQPTNAIYGFINMLNKILKEKKPKFLAVCFDVSRETFRQKKFAAYKIHRPSMPEGLKGQIPLIKEIISCYGITILEKEGFEADDIIATAVEKFKKKGLFIEIISSDKDILQLVSDGVLVSSPGKEEEIIYDSKKVKQRFSVEPLRIVDVIALMGDAVDNIPGVPGIGDKTAVELIRGFGGLEGLLNNLARVKSEKTRKALEDNIERIRLNRQLAVLDRAVDLDIDLDNLKVGRPDAKELFRLFKYLEFKRFLNDLPVEGQTESFKINEVADEDLGHLKVDELILRGASLDNLVFFFQDKFFRVDKPGANIKNILSDPRVKKIGYDLKKIKTSLAAEGIVLEGLYFDIKIAAYLLNPSKSEYTLTDMAWDYLGMMFKDKPIDSQNEADLIRRLRTVLEKELQAKSLLNLFTDIEMPLVGVLANMELNGIKLDTRLLADLSREVEKRLARLIEDIYGLADCQFNINSPKQLRNILFERLKLPVIKKTKTGPSTDEEVLRRLAAEHKLPALLLEYRQLMKLKNTYIDILPGLIDSRTGRIHTRFNQAGTETGRLSSSNPNLQNIPVKTDIGRKIRQAVVAGSAKDCLLSCDYSQIELRILAHLSGDEGLISAFRQDKDIHKATASLVYGLGENEISDSMREAAKRVNFGIVYGLSAYGLARELAISVEQGQGFIDAYFLRYPKVKEYIQRQIEQAQRHGFVVTILGRRRYIPDINNKNAAIKQFAQRQAVNTPIQGSASDLIKSAMIQIHRQISERNLSAKMVLQIHDELLFEVGREEADELAVLARDGMENVLKLDVPISVVIKKGENWSEMERV